MMRYLDVSFSGSGLISGKNPAEELTTTLGTTRIEDLPLHFAAIATESDTGHEIWLTHGRLADACRASYALPGIFPPVRIGGRWLVDGWRSVNGPSPAMTPEGDVAPAAEVSAALGWAEAN